MVTCNRCPLYKSKFGNGFQYSGSARSLALAGLGVQQQIVDCLPACLQLASFMKSLDEDGLLAVEQAAAGDAPAAAAGAADALEQRDTASDAPTGALPEAAASLAAEVGQGSAEACPDPAEDAGQDGPGPAGVAEAGEPAGEAEAEQRVLGDLEGLEGWFEVSTTFLQDAFQQGHRMMLSIFVCQKA